MEELNGSSPMCSLKVVHCYPWNTQGRAKWVISLVWSKGHPLFPGEHSGEIQMGHVPGLLSMSPTVPQERAMQLIMGHLSGVISGPSTGSS